MANKGYFILTDISGYTEFLTRSELDHAQDALQNLFDLHAHAGTCPEHVEGSPAAFTRYILRRALRAAQGA